MKTFTETFKREKANLIAARVELRDVRAKLDTIREAYAAAYNESMNTVRAKYGKHVSGKNLDYFMTESGYEVAFAAAIKIDHDTEAVREAIGADFKRCNDAIRIASFRMRRITKRGK